MKTKSSRVWFYIEKFRAFLLVFLMILCIVQVGILWSSQSGSFPFSILPSFFTSGGTSQATVEEAKGNYLLPFRIVLTAGYDDDHYVISNGSQEYKTLWDGAKLYIAQALGTKAKQIQPFNEGVWGNLAAKKPYMFEFKTEIPIDIVKWVLNPKSSPTGELTNLYKVIVCPADPDNNYADTVYIRDYNKNIYTYELQDFNSEALSKAEFRNIYQKQKDNANAKNYQMAVEAYGDDETIAQDIVGPISSSSSENYPEITCIPFPGVDGQAYGYDELNKIGVELFGKENYDYDPDEDVNGSIVFKKADSVYRLYKNSVLEYKFTGNQGVSGKLNVLDAYEEAVGFIIDHNKQDSFMSGISVYLSSIEENSNSYVFNFDYGIASENNKEEFPVILKDYSFLGSSTKLNSCISVEATSKRVIRCEWIALKFKAGKNMEHYKWTYPDMLAREYETYPVLNQKELSAKGFGVYYIISNPVLHEQVVNPNWLLLTKDGSYNIPMEKIKNK